MRDDRAVSTTLGYVLALAISSLLVSGLLVAGGSFVDDERQRVTTDELEVLGGQLAEGYHDADRLASTSGATNASVRVTLTDRAAGSGYTVTVVERSSPSDEPYHYDLVFESNAADASATVTIRTAHEVAETSVSGGPVVVRTVDTDGDGDVDRLRLESTALTPPVTALLPVAPDALMDGGDPT
jgi:hypothetical protein